MKRDGLIISINLLLLCAYATGNHYLSDAHLGQLITIAGLVGLHVAILWITALVITLAQKNERESIAYVISGLLVLIIGYSTCTQYL